MDVVHMTFFHIMQREKNTFFFFLQLINLSVFSLLNYIVVIIQISWW